MNPWASGDRLRLDPQPTSWERPLRLLAWAGLAVNALVLSTIYLVRARRAR